MTKLIARKIPFEKRGTWVWSIYNTRAAAYEKSVVGMVVQQHGGASGTGTSVADRWAESFEIADPDCFYAILGPQPESFCKTVKVLFVLRGRR